MVSLKNMLVVLNLYEPVMKERTESRFYLIEYQTLYEHLPFYDKHNSTINCENCNALNKGVKVSHS